MGSYGYHPLANDNVMDAMDSLVETIMSTTKEKNTWQVLPEEEQKKLIRKTLSAISLEKFLDAFNAFSKDIDERTANIVGSYIFLEYECKPRDNMKAVVKNCFLESAIEEYAAQITEIRNKEQENDDVADLVTGMACLCEFYLHFDEALSGEYKLTNNV